MVAKQQRKNSTTLALRKTWQQCGCMGPHPHFWSASLSDDERSSASTDDDTVLLDGVDDDRFGPATATSSLLAAGASRQRSGRTVIVVLVEQRIVDVDASRVLLAHRPSHRRPPSATSHGASTPTRVLLSVHIRTAHFDRRVSKQEDESESRNGGATPGRWKVN